MSYFQWNVVLGLLNVNQYIKLKAYPIRGSVPNNNNV